MNMVDRLFLFASAICLYCVYVNVQAQTCVNEDTCSDCLSANAKCAWCAENDFSRSRCDLVDNLKSGCKEDELYGSQGLGDLTMHITRNSEFNGTNQIKPQEVKLRLRIRQSEKFNVTVKRALNYPVDLYYLMDVSNSMKDDLEKLKALATSLTATVGNLTDNFHIGFGKFVDKETLPFVDTYGPRLADPCGTGCEPAFAFINSLPLNKSKTVFELGIQKESTSGNLDLPEGLLDALMQTAVCTEAINWRENAWHLVVMATDDQYHTAGDGKLGGIYTPNDGKCHLNNNDPGGKYVNATEQDYPSVSHIRQVLFDNRIIPMFAVTANREALYQSLRDALFPVRGFVGKLEGDSSNVLELIRTGYEEIASQVFLTASGGGETVRADIKVISCIGENASKVADDPSQQGCKGIRVDEQAVFEVSLELQNCASDPLTVIIDAGAFGQTEVTVEPLCSCACEGQATQNSEACDFHGKLECGVCSCDDGWAGAECDIKCNPDDASATAGCKPPNSTDITGCSGNGRCVCDDCLCDTDDNGKALWSGDYCECAQRGCSRDFRGEECGGAERGVCVCTGDPCSCNCNCNDPWTNDDKNLACECSTDETDCTQKGVVCSSHGICGCDQTCICNEGYFGIFCQECVGCPDVCKESNIEQCVECAKSKTSCDVDCPFNITVVDVARNDDYQLVYQNKTEITQRCELKDSNDCIYKFYVTERVLEGVRLVEAEHERLTDCPGSIDIVPIVVGIVAGIFAIGLALLFAWWILMQIAAYREYKAFVKEQANASWNQTTSPLYEPPSQKYLNPTYKGKSQKA